MPQLGAWRLRIAEVPSLGELGCDNAVPERCNAAASAAGLPRAHQDGLEGGETEENQFIIVIIIIAIVLCVCGYVCVRVSSVSVYTVRNCGRGPT